VVRTVASGSYDRRANLDVDRIYEKGHERGPARPYRYTSRWQLRPGASYDRLYRQERCAYLRELAVSRIRRCSLKHRRGRLCRAGHSHQYSNQSVRVGRSSVQCPTRRTQSHLGEPTRSCQASPEVVYRSHERAV
jgi:hypothetical protein